MTMMMLCRKRAAEDELGSDTIHLKTWWLLRPFHHFKHLYGRRPDAS